MNNKGFNSKVGFILASVGSAVGLGNIWSFPYKLASGGALFLYIYCMLALLVGVPLLISEMSVGRSSGKGVISAYKNISPKLNFLGVLSVISPCIVMSYYTVIGGLCIRYFIINFKSAFLGFSKYDSKLLFENVSSDILGGMIFAVVFMLVTYLISKNGISSGIERFNKIAMPLLFAILLFSVVKTLRQEGAVQGLVHLVVPQKKYTFSQLLGIFSSAGEQMFFSLSIAVGTMVTYGSFMDKKQNIASSAVIVTVADSLVAVMAGLTVIPAAFFYNLGEENLSGPGLLFVTMQNLFASDSRAGAVFGTLFFLLIIIAAVSSAVAFLEVPVSALTNLGVKNRGVALIFCSMVVTVPALLIAADGFRNGIMDLWVFIAEGLIIPITALIFSIYLGWFGGQKVILKEIENSKYSTICNKTFPMIFRFFSPLVLITVIIGQIINYVANT